MTETGAIRRLADAPLGIRLWLVELDAPDVAPGVDLSEPELQRARRFAFERDRRRYLAAHRALRAVLAREAGMRPSAVFELGPHGKPGLPALKGWHFNLSHSAHLGLIGLAEAGAQHGEIGVDIEVRHPIAELRDLAAHHFSMAEQAALAAMPEGEVALSAFLQGWTHKEACLKALGTGLSLPSNAFTLNLDSALQRTQIPVGEGEALLDVAAIRACPDILASAARVVLQGLARHT